MVLVVGGWVVAGRVISKLIAPQLNNDGEVMVDGDGVGCGSGKMQ